jgi:hypothetical protein
VALSGADGEEMAVVSKNEWIGKIGGVSRVPE